MLMATVIYGEKNVSPEDFIEGVRQEHLRDFTGFFIEFDQFIHTF